MNSTEASSVTNSFLSVLHSHGLYDIFSLRNWISFACDSASNMLAKNTGVYLLLLNKIPILVIWHFNSFFRLELAINGAVRHILPVCLMKTFFDKLLTICRP